MTYKEINELFGIPQRTLTDWKNSKETDWRKKVFEFLKNSTKKDIEKLLKKLNAE